MKSACSVPTPIGTGACGWRWRPSRILNNAGAETALLPALRPQEGGPSWICPGR